MRLNTVAGPDRWTDRTLSALQAGRLEACQKELAGLGGAALFDDEATDLDAERLYEQSYYAEEEEKRYLHTIEGLRVLVLGYLPAEIALLTQEEITLVIKLVFMGGEVPLMDWNDLIPARSLVKRLWCRTRPERGDWLYMPRKLLGAVMLSLANEEIKTVRDLTAEMIDTVDNTLYLAGVMSARTVLQDMSFRLQGSLAEDKPMLYRRLLRSAFETMIGRDGQLMLVHPGLADPRTRMPAESGVSLRLDQEALGELYGSLMDVEDPIYDQMMGLIGSLCRPESSPEETVEDLILLAKQGAPAEEMRKVLASRIICIPSEEMMQSLQEMHDRIPRWFTLNMEKVQ